MNLNRELIVPNGKTWDFWNLEVLNTIYVLILVTVNLKLATNAKF